MGYNTTVVFNNDVVHRMADDPDFIDKLHMGILKVISGNQVPIQIKGGTVATVIETHHADVTTVVASGNNGGEVISTHVPYPGDDLKEAILRDLADSMGYYIAKKPKKRKR